MESGQTPSGKPMPKLCSLPTGSPQRRPPLLSSELVLCTPERFERGSSRDSLVRDGAPAIAFVSTASLVQSGRVLLSPSLRDKASNGLDLTLMRAGFVPLVPCGRLKDGLRTVPADVSSLNHSR